MSRADVHVAAAAVERDRTGLVIAAESDHRRALGTDIEGAVDDRCVDK